MTQDDSRQVVDELEAKVVDVDRAAGAEPEDASTAEDVDEETPRSEPPG